MLQDTTCPPDEPERKVARPPGLPLICLCNDSGPNTTPTEDGTWQWLGGSTVLGYSDADWGVAHRSRLKSAPEGRLESLVEMGAPESDLEECVPLAPLFARKPLLRASSWSAGPARLPPTSESSRIPAPAAQSCSGKHPHHRFWAGRPGGQHGFRHV